jgi:hypothetical protein
MKNRASAMLFWAALCLSGCDGHLRTLYIAPMGSAAAFGGNGSSVIRIEGKEDVPAIVERVANELGMQTDPKKEKRWYIRTTDRDSFMLSVEKEPDGAWTISLGDWPTSARSGQSKSAEEKIRAALREPNKPPLRMPVSGTPAASASAEATADRGAPVAPPPGAAGR